MFPRISEPVQTRKTKNCHDGVQHGVWHYHLAVVEADCIQIVIVFVVKQSHTVNMASAAVVKSASSEANNNPGIEVENSFSADSPYFSSYVENELRSMSIMNETLHDIAGRTKTFGKCGALMSEATRRLALACRLRRPVSAEDEKEGEHNERIREMQVAERRRAVGDDMAGLLGVMSEVGSSTDSSKKSAISFVQIFLKSIVSYYYFRCWMKLLTLRFKCVSHSKQRW